MSSLIEELQAALEERYQVTGEIGHGGMATVFRAHDLRHGREVAIKLLSPDLSATIGAERFQREIQIAARLSHPNILPVYDSGEAAGLLYYVMPVVEGESLRDRIDHETQLPIEDAVAIACEIADALGYAHEHNVVHRDVKPENVLISDGHAIVADFGIARVTDTPHGQTLTGTGISLGTACYMSPEQFAGEPVDGRSDIYALGVVLYEMLVGQVPFTGPTALAVMARASIEPPPSIHVVRSTVPEEIEHAVYQALEKAPADRFRTMREFKEALLGGKTSSYAARTARYTARYTATHATAGAFWRSGRAMLVGALVLAAVGGTAWWRRSHAEPLVMQAGIGGDVVSANRLAVLYFTDRSRDGHLRAVADGLTESLIDALERVPVLRVVSRNGVAPFRHAGDVAPDSIARALGVGSLVEGSVESLSGGRVRVTVRLIDGNSGVDLGRKTFERRADDLPTLEDSLSEQVAEFLRPLLGDEVHISERKEETRSVAAWLAVQQAEERRKAADSLASVARQPDVDSAMVRGAIAAGLGALDQADKLLVRAEAADPKWADPPTLRAVVAHDRVLFLDRGDPRIGAVVDSGLAAASRALALAPRSADALEAKGNLLVLRFDQLRLTDIGGAKEALARAETTLTRAVSINANQAGAWAALSQLYYKKPDLEQAELAAMNAYNADAYLHDAHAILVRLFWTQHDSEHFPEARKWCDELGRRFPKDAFAAECRLWMYTTRFEHAPPDSVWAWHARYLKLTPARNHEFWVRKARLLVASAFAQMAMADSAHALLHDPQAPASVDPDRELPIYAAIAHVKLGELDTATELIKSYLVVHPDHRAGFASRTGLWWRGLQDYPKFRALIAGAN